MRGGILNGNFPMIVQRMIAWTDYHTALALLDRPRFPTLNIPETENVEDFIYPAIPESRDPSRFRNGDSPNPDSSTRRIEQVFAGIGEMSKLLKRLRKGSTLIEDNIWYSDKVYYLQRKLIDVIYCPKEHATPLDRVAAVTALMYCAHCLRDMPISFSVITRSVTRVKDAVLKYEEDYSPKNSEERQLIFWILAFGGLAAEGKRERDWFVAKFRKSCDELYINDWETVKEVLESFLWQEELDDGATKLWMEAMLGDF